MSSAINDFITASIDRSIFQSTGGELCLTRRLKSDGHERSTDPTQCMDRLTCSCFGRQCQPHRSKIRPACDSCRAAESRGTTVSCLYGLLQEANDRLACVHACLPDIEIKVPTSPLSRVETMGTRPTTLQMSVLPRCPELFCCAHIDHLPTVLC